MRAVVIPCQSYVQPLRPSSEDHGGGSGDSIIEGRPSRGADSMGSIRMRHRNGAYVACMGSYPRTPQIPRRQIGGTMAFIDTRERPAGEVQQTVGKMRLSGAIRIGARIRPQCEGSFFEDGRSCAMGAAMEGSGLPYREMREASQA